MVQQPIELILLKQWAELVASPVWLMDAEGNLVYYNEAAELILGMRFDETGEINAGQLSEMFNTTAPDGTAIEAAELPVVKALVNGVPAHGEVRIKDGRGEWREINVSAVPLVSAEQRMVGVMAMFWEVTS